MNTSKQQYLEQIRSNTAYPTYRGIIGLIAVLGYISAIIIAIGAVYTGINSMNNPFMGGSVGGIVQIIVGLVGAVFVFIAARFWKEAALILVDLGDSVTEANSRANDGARAPLG